MGFLRVPGFLSPSDCRAVRAGMDVGLAEAAEILGAGFHHHPAIRATTVIDPPADLIREVERRLERCRERVATALRIPVGEREGTGFLRYSAGGFYRPHRDRGHDSEWNGAARRAVALVVFLNTSRDASPDGEFDGGVLRLFLPDGDVDEAPEAGTLVAFPADTLHEVTEVRDGTRDAVVDWFYFAALTGT